jgi:hypothetical protein
LAALYAHAEATFKLDCPATKDAKISLRESLQQVFKTTGVYPDGLKVPPCPDELDYLLRWSYSLIRSESITYTEIYHWMQLTNNHPMPWEIDVILRIDNLYHRIRNG